MDFEHMDRAVSRSRWVWPIASFVAAAVILLIVPSAIGLPLAVEHAQYHAIFALAVLAPAFAIAWRRRAASLAGTAATVGLTAFGFAQVVESIGGLGFGPDNDGRVNWLAQVHDLGLGLTGIGLVVLLLCIVVAVASIVGRRSGRPVLASVAAGAALVVGGLGVVKLLGF